MIPRWRTGGRLLLLTGWLTACSDPEPTPPDAGTQDAGTQDAGTGDAGPREITDACNSREEALTLPECALPLDNTPRQAWLGATFDSDWYRVEAVAPVTAPSIVRLRAGYTVPQTPVSLWLGAYVPFTPYRPTSRVDRHDPAKAPSTLELLIPYAGEAAFRLLTLRDDTSAFDTQSPYTVQAELIPDPDGHEPNNLSPSATAIPLTATADGASGTTTGVLATEGDVDCFRFDVPASTKRISLHLTTEAFSPELPFRFSYLLLTPEGGIPARQTALDPAAATDLRSTTPASSAGRWVIWVQASKALDQDFVMPGDLRSRYTLQVNLSDTEAPGDSGTPPIP
ncbi:hypothetical protein D7X32_18105 [Corallococcus carmarthensis]|uniref:Lipoprotein n=1 Tax=Corallococcus carmarthensis TaxID=2316728 RepID=A0A3A8K3Y7_9BACT|nr:hypothetical protein D7X32_18105 [Corallococcus carmarthensis]